MESLSSTTLFTVLGALSFLSFLLLFATSFVKVSIVLGLLRNAVGTPETPSGMVIGGIALVLTMYVMYPVARKAWRAAAPTITEVSTSSTTQKDRVAMLMDAAEAASEPWISFLKLNSSEETRRSLVEGIRSSSNESPEEDSVVIVAPAFLLQEISEAFRMAFFLFLPFLVVDLVVAAALMSLGMHMLAPPVISLPFKLLLFAAVDGFTLVSRALMTGYVYPS